MIVVEPPGPPAAAEAPQIEPSGQPASAPLGQVAVRSGSYLVAREAVGMVIRLVGIVITVRAIGPRSYGIYAGAAAYVLFMSAFAQMGSEIYLIRAPATLERRVYDQAFTFLLCTSFGATALSVALTYAFAPWLRPVGVLLPLRILLLSTPINVLWAPAQAAIERQFRYRKMGILEVGGDLCLYGTAVPLALLGAGAWSLVAGFFAWQSWLLVGSFVMAGMRPRWDWSRATVRELSRHGLTFSVSQWVSRLSGLVNPLVVGSFAGAVGVGYVAFAYRLTDTLAFAQRGAYRLGMVAMSRVHSSETERLRYGIEEGSLLQAVALAIPFAVFGVAAHWIIPLLFGHAWVAAIPIYTLLALAVVLNAQGIIQTTFLYSRGYNSSVTLAAAVQTVVLGGTSIVLVRHFGIDGFGYAFLIALVDLFVLDRMVRRITPISYRRQFPLVAAFAPLVLFPLVPMPWALLLALPVIVFSLLPGFRAEEERIVQLVWSGLRRRP
ncbi:MAG TPA: oligosaccharide flippase family protein [Acidimicrobiales bacterium]|nr:oligosaccharide flippase family protein [Acidimicrobiales bacterium]